MPAISMEKVSSSSVERFMEKDFIAKAEGEPSEKLDSAIRYGLAYREAFRVLEDQTRIIHMEAVKMREVLFLIKDELEKIALDSGVSMRLIGGVCQQIKVC